MTYKPFSSQYKFDDSVLIKNFPAFFKKSLESWIINTLDYARKIEKTRVHTINPYKDVLKNDFIEELELCFREVLPKQLYSFISFIFVNQNRTCEILNYILQSFATKTQALELKEILTNGGSAYTVEIITNDLKTETSLIYRVPEIIKEQSEKALNENQLLQEAWTLCYGINPDYEKVVNKCQDFLEHFIKKTYFPNENKPQFGRLIGNLRSSSTKKTQLNFKGENVIDNKEDILSLINNFAKYRGIHTAGNGKIPTKEEAEYILHTTIYFWNLHQKT